MIKDPLNILKFQVWYETDLKDAKTLILDFVKDSNLQETYVNKITSTLDEIQDKNRLDLFVKNILPKFNKLGLTEMKVDDPGLEEQIKNFAELSDQIDRLQVELKRYESQYRELEEILRPLLEQLQEADRKGLEIDGILVTIKRKGYQRESYAYKEAYEWLVQRVNPAMKALAQEALDTTKKVARIASSIGVQRLGEATMVSNIFNRLKELISGSVEKIQIQNKELQDSTSEFINKVQNEL
jgi:hypothetical protein